MAPTVKCTNDLDAMRRPPARSSSTSRKYAAARRVKFVRGQHASNCAGNLRAAGDRWLNWRRFRIIVAVRAHKSKINDRNAQSKCLPQNHIIKKAKGSLLTALQSWNRIID